MNCAKAIRFKVDKEFARLIQQFSHEELLHIFSDPLKLKLLVFHTWNDILADDIGYYKSALQLNVPFEIRPLLKKHVKRS